MMEDSLFLEGRNILMDLLLASIFRSTMQQITVGTPPLLTCLAELLLRIGG